MNLCVENAISPMSGHYPEIEKKVKFMEVIIVLSLVGVLFFTPLLLVVISMKSRPIRAVKFVEQGRHSFSPADKTAKMLNYLLASQQNPNRSLLKNYNVRIEEAIATLQSNPRWKQWEEIAYKRNQRSGAITNIINGLSNI